MVLVGLTFDCFVTGRQFPTFTVCIATSLRLENMTLHKGTSPMTSPIRNAEFGAQATSIQVCEESIQAHPLCTAFNKNRQTWTKQSTTCQRSQIRLTNLAERPQHILFVPLSQHGHQFEKHLHRALSLLHHERDSQTQHLSQTNFLTD